MAVLDLTRERLTIRIVYDGCGMAGKTSTLKSLAESLGRPLSSPGEALGRTLYFDWMDYPLRSWNGLRVHCQIVSAPGQDSLKKRRDLLVRGADAIVFVLDTSVSRIQKSLETFETRLRSLQEFEEPRPVMLVQANKRDSPDAISRKDLDEFFSEEPSIRVLESVATEGIGVREVFAAAVSAALEQAEALSKTGMITLGPGRVEESSQLMEELLDSEARSSSSEGAFGDEEPILRKVIQQEIGALSKEPPNPSSSDHETVASLPVGSIWPVPQGRQFAAEIASLTDAFRALIPRPETRMWGPWQLQVVGANSHPTAAQARQELRRQVRIWNENHKRLSSRRCLFVLPAPYGDGWWLWQGAAQLPSLQDLAMTDCGGDDLRQRVLWWLYLGGVLFSAKSFFAGGSVALPWTRKTLSVESSLPVFKSLIPEVESAGSLGDPALEFELLVEESLAACPEDPLKLLATLRSLRLSNPLLGSASRVLDKYLVHVLNMAGAPEAETVDLSHSVTRDSMKISGE